jgi:parvulin-like peptidyl-prolyl isomerase
VPGYLQQVGASPAAPPQQPQPGYTAPGVSISSIGSAFIPGVTTTSAPAAIAAQPGAPTVVTDPALSKPSSEMDSWDGSKIVARVGTDVILWCDVIGPVNERIAAVKDKIPPNRLEELKMQAVQQRLQQLIQTKILCNEARRKAGDALKKINDKLVEVYEERELPNVMAKGGFKSRDEIEQRLRETGSSIEHMRHLFIDTMIAQDWLRQRTMADKDIQLDTQLSYYEVNRKKYEFPARARWEIITVRFDRFPNKEAAYRSLAEAGNRVWRGEPFSEVAKQVSQGSTASNGGQYDWTTRGSLASEVIDRAAFSLPVGQLSPIIEDQQGFHIMRVIERQDAGRTPFADVQQEIKEQLKKERQNAAADEYLATLQKNSKIWTIFDPTAAAPADGMRR